LQPTMLSTIEATGTGAGVAFAVSGRLLVAGSYSPIS
jgi:hypothetical protein